MKIDDKQVIAKLRELVEKGTTFSNLLRDGEGDIAYGSHQRREHNAKYYEEVVSWKGACINLLKNRFGRDSYYLKDFVNRVSERGEYSGEFYKENLSKATGVLKYILDALENGLTEDLFYQREILIFSDLLDQAYEFLDKGLREAAAIYGRIVLEITIKEFAVKNNIQESSFDQTIIKLRTDEKIHLPFENSLRANYGIGNLAAHCKEDFKKISDNEIKEYLNFIRDKVLTLK